ncbi:MAG: TOBE domain-containing protein, partial [Actinobacteria bacterium]|nr:TOBE domain-containing protein [Actinomycetota bacterium]
DIANPDFEIRERIFFIRPEKIKILDEFCDKINNRQNMNIFKGKLASMIFEGPDIRLIINTGEFGKLKAEIKNDKTYYNLKENSEITYYWEDEDGKVL